MLVDDVITAGTAIRESMEIIQANGADACWRVDFARSSGTGGAARFRRFRKLMRLQPQSDLLSP